MILLFVDTLKYVDKKGAGRVLANGFHEMVLAKVHAKSPMIVKLRCKKRKGGGEEEVEVK